MKTYAEAQLEHLEQQEQKGVEPTEAHAQRWADQPLSAWWVAEDSDAYGRTVPKIAEYGTHDLTEIGRSLGRLMDWSEMTDAEAAEVGCWFYLQGKVARAMEALGRHQLPSHDTAFDTRIYAKMILAYKERGALK